MCGVISLTSQDRSHFGVASDLAGAACRMWWGRLDGAGPQGDGCYYNRWGVFALVSAVAEGGKEKWYWQHFVLDLS